MDNNTEIVNKSELLNQKGKLNQTGWMRKPLLSYNREQIAVGWHRIKEWDYFAILSDEFGITLTIADLGIMSLFNVVWLDFKEKTFISKEETKLFSKGKTNLPHTSTSGITSYQGKNLSIHLDRNAGNFTLSIDFKNYSKGDLVAKFELNFDPNADSIVMSTPWKNKPKHFYYNQKINCIDVNGTVKIGEETIVFPTNNSFAVLDWGRGVWPYRDTWYWGSASGRLNGKLFGFNIGYGFGDPKGTENMIFYDGIGHKLDIVEFHIDSNNFLNSWKFTSNDGRFNMEFQPIIDRNSVVNLLIFKSVQHQVFGYFSGFVILDNNEKLSVNNFLGFAEKVYNRW
ncbi:MAG: DUF2804 domain-containing protein [Candidatus Heimdallarchaeota archaeon]|nr:DUF2804 domain-containing protein [Candidatus Heimdallarchaeota archaeon]